MISHQAEIDLAVQAHAGEKEMIQESISEVMSNVKTSNSEDGFVAHTSGPWFVLDFRDSHMRAIGWEGPFIDRILITNRAGRDIDGGSNCVVARIQFENRSEPLGAGNLADAHLIAAAPAMFAALNEVEEFLDNQADVEDGDYGVPRPNRAMRLLIEVRDAISKARGIIP